MLMLLLLAALVLPADVEVLILRSGEQIALDAPPVEKDRKLIFRSGGRLFSLSLAEIDAEATRRRHQEGSVAHPPAEQPVNRLIVSTEERDRLLARLEESRGSPAPHQQPAPAAPPPLPRPETLEERRERQASERLEERWWREQATRYREAVTRAEEELRLITTRAERLESHILGLLSVGHHPDQFGLQVFQLELARSQIEPARLEVERARRALQRFHETARREGILPGWLR
jgi:hypothetical protein